VGGSKDRSALLMRADRAYVAMNRTHREFFTLIEEVDRTRAWADDGARDLAQWMWMRYGMSDWKARRFIETAAALPHLPAISEALGSGELGVDKVLELTRFAKVETEDGLIPWARQVSAARIRQEADVVRRGEPDEAAADDAVRSVTWAFRDEGRRFEMHADLPAAQGAAVATAIDRVARTLPSMPHEQGDLHMLARRADALVGLCSARLAEDPDPDRATVVVHARVGTADPRSNGCCARPASRPSTRTPRAG
jgi:hypothetical protein